MNAHRRTMTLEEEAAWLVLAEAGAIFGDEFIQPCVAPVCPRPHYGRGMCKLHYNQWWRAQKRATS